eukprot:gene11325-4137_t
MSKKTVTTEEWKKKVDQVKISKKELDKIVMNYLVVEGYQEAAEMFQQESNTPTEIDLNSITERVSIRNSIQNGNIEEAIEKVNDLNPEILDTNQELFFLLQQQQLIELIRDGKIEEALDFAQDELAPRGEENKTFLNEIEKTMSLLAFENTKDSPMNSLLDISHRHKTASELNAAILDSLSQEKSPKLPRLLKMLVWTEKKLDQKLNFPHFSLEDMKYVENDKMDL